MRPARWVFSDSTKAITAIDGDALSRALLGVREANVCAHGTVYCDLDTVEGENVETPAGLPGPRVTEVGDLPLRAGRWVTDAGDRVRAASFPIRKGAPSPYLDACGGGRHLLPSP